MKSAADVYDKAWLAVSIPVCPKDVGGGREPCSVPTKFLHTREKHLFVVVELEKDFPKLFLQRWKQMHV